LHRDLGDFQTPPALVAMVLGRLDSLGIPRTRVLEPTCGRGHFVTGLLDRINPPVEVFGFELQADHLEAARRSLALASNSNVTLEQADFFAVDLKSLPWQTSGPVLIVGNPPWVTTATLGRLASANRPARVPIEGLTGLDARTGRSNFDLAEAVWHKILTELDESDATIALLCKTATARNVLRWAARTSCSVVSASIHRIDARQWFGAAIDGCLFIVRLGAGRVLDRAEVFPDLISNTPETVVGVADGLLVADLAAFDRTSAAFGRCRHVWRQGVKHDAARVMELIETDGILRNGHGEVVDVERDHVFPLMKGADLARRFTEPLNRRVLVTQRRLGENTASLAQRSPRLWAYLSHHSAAFNARKSKVYASRSPFAMFGVGDYTFASDKVAIAGLHKGSSFRSIGPVEGRPVLLDDTCYFLPCSDKTEADRVAGLLNGPQSRELIDALRFSDAKRPITKAILQRIDIDRLDSQPGPIPLASSCGVK